MGLRSPDPLLRLRLWSGLRWGTLVPQTPVVLPPPKPSAAYGMIT